jgi:hypothetical protein
MPTLAMSVWRRRRPKEQHAIAAAWFWRVGVKAVNG